MAWENYGFKWDGEYFGANKFWLYVIGGLVVVALGFMTLG